MKRVIRFGLILTMVAVLTLIGVGATATLAAAPAIQEIQGTIAGVNNTTVPYSVTVAPKAGGTPVVLQVNDSTLITKAGIGKATLSELAVNDRIVATYSGTPAVAKKLSVSQPLAKHHSFVGTIKGDPMSNSFIVTTKNQGEVTIKVNSETKYKVPSLKNPALSNFKSGDKVAVLAVEVTTGGVTDYLALHVVLIPGKPISIQRVGTITAYTAGSSITLEDKKGGISNFLVNSSTKILYKKGITAVVTGEQATVIASRDPASAQYTAKAILVFGTKKP